MTKGNRIIVPTEMRPEMLQYIHEGYQSKEKYLLHAKDTVFWPGLTYDTQELVEKCSICQECGNSQLIIGRHQDVLPFPWHTFAKDLFYYNRMDFLVVPYVYSRLPNYQIPHHMQCTLNCV